MKILDKYLLKTFLITFTSVFVILFFIFILQTVWLFISELAGKDLDFILIMKFLLFSMPRIIPLVLPLSVLLASIMTFGGLAENYEFAAMKSAGISLQRSMKGLTIFILILSIVTFIFANNVIPYAEYKFINFRRNIAQIKPAMAIVEGQFSEIGNYTIRVDKKSGKNGNILTGVLIHIKSLNGEGLKTVINAKSGELISSSSSNTLELVLYDGYYYEDIIPAKYEERVRIPFAKASFKKDVINIDLSKLNTNMETGQIANTSAMLNASEIKYTLDSLTKNYKKDVISYTENISQRLNPYRTPVDNDLEKISFDINNPLNNLTDLTKIAVLNNAKSSIESTLFAIDGSKIDFEAKQKNINEHWIALYDKFMIAFSCILMFFIGAPLGAIIRKGGLGLPIVFAVAIFIIFHFINTFGKKVAQESGITPFMGTWMSTLLLSPLAVLLTYRATNDIGLVVNFDFLITPFQKLVQKLNSSKNIENLFTQPFIDLEHYPVIEDNEWKDFSQKSDDALIDIVKNYRQQNYSEESRTKALKILETRNISQEKLIASHSLYNIDYLKIENSAQYYFSFNKLALLFYCISLIIAIILTLNFSKGLVIGLIITLIILYINIYSAQKRLEEIERVVKKKFDPGMTISIILGFPLFFLLYFLNNKTVKNSLSEYR